MRQDKWDWSPPVFTVLYFFFVCITVVVFSLSLSQRSLVQSCKHHAEVSSSNTLNTESLPAALFLTLICISLWGKYHIIIASFYASGMKLVPPTVK